jgi:hypothetical protein
MTDSLPSKKQVSDLVVTKNGVPFADQAEGLRQFKEACGMRPSESPVTHQEIFSAVHHHASEIARLTAAVPVACTGHEPSTATVTEIALKYQATRGDAILAAIDRMIEQTGGVSNGIDWRALRVAAPPPPAGMDEHTIFRRAAGRDVQTLQDHVRALYTLIADQGWSVPDEKYHIITGAAAAMDSGFPIPPCTAQVTTSEPPCFAEKNDGVFYQCACSKCRAALTKGAAL